MPSPLSIEVLQSTEPTFVDEDSSNPSCKLVKERILRLNKLYGRDNEIEILSTVYNRFKDTNTSKKREKTDFVLIQGVTGSGKTALVEKFFAPMCKKDDIFYISGKFDQLMQLQNQFSAFWEALTWLAKYASEDMKNRSDFKTIQSMLLVQEELYLLKNMVPAINTLLDSESDVSESEHHLEYDDVDSIYESQQSFEATNRLKYASRLFLRTVASLFDKPIVFFLDDLHWADESALDMLASLLYDSSSMRMLFVATCRSDTNQENMIKMLKQLRTGGVCVTKIDINGLDELSSIALMKDVLKETEDDSIVPFMILVYKWTKGNVFFLLEVLQILVRRGLISFKESLDCPMWLWDNDRVTEESTKSLENLLTETVNLLPDEIALSLKFASCLGSKIDKEILGYLLGAEFSIVESYLNAAVEVGLLTTIDGQVRFVHDAIQEVLHRSISAEEKTRFHYRIGRRLWRVFDMKQLDEQIFLVVGQLLLGFEHINDERERVAVAKLCLRAGEHAIHSSSYQTAYKYLTSGIKLLGKRTWRDEHNLTLSLYNTTAEVAYCVGHFEDVQSMVKEIHIHATNFKETLRGHAILVFALGSSGRLNDAIDYGLKILRDLGESFPRKYILISTLIEIKRVCRHLKRKTNESLLRLPEMQNEKKIAAMHILSMLLTYTYITNPILTPAVILRMVKLTLDHGMCAMSCIGFAGLGTIMCGPLNEIEEGFRIGKVGWEMHERFPLQVWSPRVTALYVMGCCSFKRPLTEGLKPLKIAYRNGIRSGDLEFAFTCAISFCFSRFEFVPLTEHVAAYEDLREQIIVYGQETALMMTVPMLQAMHNLIGKGNSDPSNISGEILDEDFQNRFCHSEEKFFVFMCFHRLMLGYLFGNHEGSEEYSRAIRPAVKSPFGAMDAALMNLFDALSTLERTRKLPSRRYRRYVVKEINRMRKWAKHSPETFICRQYLLEAELAWYDGDHISVYGKFFSAIASAKESRNLFQTALSNERAGRYFHSMGDNGRARGFLQESLVYYEKWGAEAKVNHLYDEMRDVLKA